jgi:hypothetical protein
MKRCKSGWQTRMAHAGGGGAAHLLDLRRGVREDGGVGAGGGAVHVASVAKQRGGAPQQAHAALALQAGRMGGDDVQRGVALLQGGALGRDVAVVEAPVGDAQLAQQLEEDVKAAVRQSHGIQRRVLPGPALGGGAKGVGAVAAHRVPVGQREFEPA